MQKIEEIVMCIPGLRLIYVVVMAVIIVLGVCVAGFCFMMADWQESRALRKVSHDG